MPVIMPQPNHLSFIAVNLLTQTPSVSACFLREISGLPPGRPPLDPCSSRVAITERCLPPRAASRKTAPRSTTSYFPQMHNAAQICPFPSATIAAIRLTGRARQQGCSQTVAPESTASRDLERSSPKPRCYNLARFSIQFQTAGVRVEMRFSVGLGLNLREVRDGDPKLNTVHLNEFLCRDSHVLSVSSRRRSFCHRPRCLFLPCYSSTEQRSVRAVLHPGSPVSEPGSWIVWSGARPGEEATPQSRSPLSSSNVQCAQITRSAIVHFTTRNPSNRRGLSNRIIPAAPVVI